MYECQSAQSDEKRSHPMPNIAAALIGGVYRILEILGIERKSGAQVTGGRETNGAEFVAGPSSSEILLRGAK